MISKYVECLIPITKCNLECEYCYVIQEKRRDNKAPKFKKIPKEIGKAFDAHRWGGKMLVNLCGAGETMLCQELPEIVYHIVKEGHIVNITNNGTVTKSIKELLSLPEEITSRILFSFSLHYLELKKRGMLKVFADNVKRVKVSKASFFVQINLCDGYIECLEEIKEYCMHNFGALPQVALTRKEFPDMDIYTKHSKEEYKKYAKQFDSPMFDMMYDNFKVKRTEYCNAGKRSYTLNLATGDLKRCYFEKPFMNIYDSDENIPERSVGNHCGDKFCINAIHFISLGVVPEINCLTYAGLRNREGAGWFKETILNELASKFE